MKTPLLLFVLVLVCAVGNAQEKKYKVGIVASYNLQNLFDTIDDPKKNDDDYTPNGVNHYTGIEYREKVKRLADVLEEIGTDISPDGFSLMAVEEVENAKVLQDLINQPVLAGRHLRIVHFDGPDERGLDPALIYNPKYFTIKHSEPLFVRLVNGDGTPHYTRDVLWVNGLYNGEMIHLFINHWPSRMDGENAGSGARAAAAAVCKRVIDSLMHITPLTKVIVMGDLNDDPVALSVTKVLGARSDMSKLVPGELYNPWVDLYSNELGTVYYNESWGLFDQMLFSTAFLNKSQKGFYFHAVHIFNKPYLLNKSGKLKGFPMGNYEGNIFVGGYSDHLPTYGILLKETK